MLCVPYFPVTYEELLPNQTWVHLPRCSKAHLLSLGCGKASKKEKKESEVTQSCLTLCDPKDCSLPGSSVHGIFQARLVEWVAISFTRGSSRLGDQTWVSHRWQMLYHLSHYFWRFCTHPVLLWNPIQLCTTTITSVPTNISLLPLLLLLLPLQHQLHHLHLLCL